MKNYKKVKITSLVFLLLILLFGYTQSDNQRNNQKNSKQESNFKDGKFMNQYKNIQFKVGDFFSIMWDFIWKKSKTAKAKPEEIPLIKWNKNRLLKMKNYSVFRVGHSTLIFKIDGKHIITDPIFSKRASPVSFAGPKKFHQNPIEIKDLPKINVVLISHNHYDHLDKESIKLLKNKVDHFYVPLKVAKHLKKFGVPANQIFEFNWWQQKKYQDFNFVFTPMQHFSGRGLFDSGKTLWGSWVIKTPKASFFFSGDGGYFKGFKEIGKRYGPFEMTFLENGAYNEKWRDVHMMPQETIQAHLDLKGKILFPIHKGSFDLALHSWKDPFEEITKEAIKKKVLLVQPKMGEEIPLLKYELKYEKKNQWWK